MKKVIFEGNTLDVIRYLPEDVRQRSGYEIDRIQRNLEPVDWKPFPAIGPGVREIRIKINGQYRIIYMTKFENKVHVLHVFKKKTQKTRHTDINIAKSRFNDVIRRYK